MQDLEGLGVHLIHFSNLAYDAPLWFSPHITMTWLQLWTAREFGFAVANDMVMVMDDYGMLLGRKKFEMLGPQLYSLVNYSEAQIVLSEWSDLVGMAQASTASSIPPRNRLHSKWYCIQLWLY